MAITEQQFNTVGLTGWRWGTDHIIAAFATGDFMSGLAFVTAVAEAAEEAGHHPDVELTYPSVGITLTSHDVGAVTDRDLALARRIDAIAAERGLEHG